MTRPIIPPTMEETRSTQVCVHPIVTNLDFRVINYKFKTSLIGFPLKKIIIPVHTPGKYCGWNEMPHYKYHTYLCRLPLVPTLKALIIRHCRKRKTNFCCYWTHPHTGTGRSRVPVANGCTLCRWWEKSDAQFIIVRT